MKKKYKLKNKKRFIITIMILISIIFSIFVFTTKFPHSQQEQKYMTITIVSGDTLWDIADDITINQDIRKVVRQIKEINQMKTSDLHVGQAIKIPIN